MVASLILPDELIDFKSYLHSRVRSVSKIEFIPIKKGIDLNNPDKQYIASTMSKIGGLYYCPQGMTRPQYDNRSYQLLLQLNFKDLKYSRFSFSLPKSGLLQILCLDYYKIKTGYVKNNVIVRYHRKYSKSKFIKYNPSDIQHVINFYRLPFKTTHAVHFKKAYDLCYRQEDGNQERLNNVLSKNKSLARNLKSELITKSSKVGGYRLINKRKSSDLITLVSLDFRDFLHGCYLFFKPIKRVEVKISQSDLNKLDFSKIYLDVSKSDSF